MKQDALQYIMFGTLEEVEYEHENSDILDLFILQVRS